MASGVCRACGSGLPSDAIWEALEKYVEIYSQLTAIQLENEKILPELKICLNCVEKLQEFEQFRKLCLQVHWKLHSEPLHNVIVKQEVDPDQMMFHVETELVEADDFKSESESDNDENDDDFEDDDDDEEDEDNRPLKDLIKTETTIDGNNDSLAADNKKKRAKYGSLKDRPQKARIPIYSCDRCPKKFRVILRLEAHKRTHDGLKPFECELCGKDFAKWNNLKTHHIQKHTDQKIAIPCGFAGCDQKFATRQGQKRHYLRTHDPTYVIPEQTAFVCDTCGKTFTTNGALKKHKFIHAPNEMPFVCGLCGKKFPTSHKLKEHTMRHEGIKNHTCSYCGLRKTTMHELKTHINTVHSKSKTYPCEICTSEFTNIGNLNRHVKIVHLGMKPYVCYVCERAFGKSDHLKRHMRSHNLPPSAALPAPRIPRAPPVYAELDQNKSEYTPAAVQS
ncbi:zinc finger protein 652-A-like [Armigeres subalbatus]|uniref:zinc finger protein 652-A-like n=1 Tax=Armigeres subalbatus TaxID=124917 RepID=UPI002ED0F894